jgi:hypothetical protein
MYLATALMGLGFSSMTSDAAFAAQTAPGPPARTKVSAPPDLEDVQALEDGFTQLIWDLASRSGFATFRVDKPGVGESDGPKCRELDWTTEFRKRTCA